MADPDPHTVDRILDATRTLLARSGVHALSFRSVAREAGLSPGTVTYYFESRDALLEAVLDRHHDRLSDLAEPLLRLPPELLRAHLSGVARLVRFAFESRDDIRLRIATWAARWTMTDRRRDILSRLLLHATENMAAERWTAAERRVIVQALVFATQRFAASSGDDLRAITGASTEEEAQRLIEQTMPRMLDALFA